MDTQNAQTESLPQSYLSFASMGPDREQEDGKKAQVCVVCGQKAPDTRFSERHKDCNRCRTQRRKLIATPAQIEKRNKRDRQQYQKNREVILAHRRATYRKTPERIRATNLRARQKYREKDIQRRRKWKYGISPEVFLQMVEAHQGKCSICLEPFGSQQQTHIDHDHKSGRIRGLLCSSCNKGLGFFRDQVTLLERAVAYLQKS